MVYDKKTYTEIGKFEKVFSPSQQQVRWFQICMNYSLLVDEFEG